MARQVMTVRMKRNTNAEAIKKIIELINTQDDIREAEEIAYKNGITLTEIWADDGEEIIGMMVEDETIYF